MKGSEHGQRYQLVEALYGLSLAPSITCGFHVLSFHAVSEGSGFREVPTVLQRRADEPSVAAHLCRKRRAMR